jgi:hypothetical protein
LWISHAKGRAVKLVAQLLPFLPQKHDYRIILMERSLEEVLASQRVMLDRSGQDGATISSEKLMAIYKEQLLSVLDSLKKRNLQVLRVSHHEAIKNPNGIAHSVARFLDLSLDCNAMAAAIDPSLHRQRRSS